MQASASLTDRLTSELGLRHTFRQVRLPDPVGRLRPPVTIDALWTCDDAKPRPDNLALLLCKPVRETEVRAWKRRLKEWRAGALLLPITDRFHFLLKEGDQIRSRLFADQDALVREVAQHRERLFTPRALSRFQYGQLSFAALETTVTRESFSFLLQNQDHLVKRVGDAIKKAIETEAQLHPGQDKAALSERVLQVAFAYLASRILEDKGFFGPEALPEDDPLKSLDRAVERVNGFLKQAQGVVNSLHLETQQLLGYHLGVRVTFALMDYHHIGQLYEHLVHVSDPVAGGQAGALLQQHYTPTALADRLLAHLPLERIRPESRLIFDPAAGSGSLLLAATRRLAFMPDLFLHGVEKERYLGNRVVGNDLDPQARLLTALKYLIIHESEPIPFPHPRRFLAEDFNTFDAEGLARRLGQRPTVLVANPPFGEVGEKKDVQLAAQFVDKALGWMRPGDMFGFVLPQIFLHGTSQGCGSARKQLLKECQLLEVWELPEGTVGHAARQPVCVLAGIAGRNGQSSIKGRVIISGSEAQKVTDGYLGVGHLVEPTEDEALAISAVPTIQPNVSTIRLDSLFFPFIGVTLSPPFPPIPVPEEGIECCRFWKSSFRQRGRLWADASGVSEEERWIRCVREGLDSPSVEQQRDFLKEPEWAHRDLFNLPKVLISRSTNRNARDPLAAILDTIGLTPNNDVYCLITRRQAAEHGLELLPDTDVPLGWEALTDEEQLLWLLGLLSSDLVNEMALASRSVRHIKLGPIRELQLPTRIDAELIELVRQMIGRDQSGQPIPEPDPLRAKLNELVEAAYGTPVRPHIARMGLSQDFKSWQEELKRPCEVVTGQVLEVLSTGADSRIHLHLSGLMDEEEEADLPLPPELPGWALDGTVFTAELSDDVSTFDELRRRPWALRGFRHSPCPYLTADELTLTFEEAP